MPRERRQSFEESLRGFALLFDFTRVFLVFTLTAVVGTMYSRWWEMRRLIGVVIGRTQDTTIMVATYIQGDQSGELKCDLVRYLNLAHALMYIQARGKHGSEPLFTLEELKCAELITPSELETLRSHEGVAALHSVAYMWFLQLWLEAVQEGLVHSSVASTTHKAVQENVSLMRGAGAEVFMYQSTPPPIGYFRVLYMLLNVSLLIAPLGVYASLLDRNAGGRESGKWMVVPVVFVITFFLLSFIQMCYEMFDPFAEGLSHFPLKQYLGDTLRSSFALLEMPREGRLRYYGALQCPRGNAAVTPTNIRDSEHRLRSMIKRQKTMRSSHNLFQSSMQDISEREALQDVEEGRRLMGRSHAGLALGSWLADFEIASPMTQAKRARSMSSVI